VQDPAFAPWGGLAACTSPDQCVATGAGQPGPPGIATCVRFGPGSGLPSDGRYCVCSIFLHRRGAGCAEHALSPAWAVLQAVLVLGTALVVGQIVRTIVRATRLRLLRSNAFWWTYLSCLVTMLCVLLWMVCRLALVLGANAAFTPNAISAGLSMTTVTFTLSAGSLSWQAAIDASRIGAAPSRRRAQVVKFVVLVLSTGLGIATIVLLFTGYSREASHMVLIYFSALILVHWRIGSKLKSMLRKHMSDNIVVMNADPFAKACSRIHTCIVRLRVFIVLFTVSIVAYSKGITDGRADSLQPPLHGALGLVGMQTSCAFCIKLIADYVAWPIRNNIRSTERTCNTRSVEQTFNVRSTEQTNNIRSADRNFKLT